MVRGGAGKRKGNRTSRRSMSPAGRAWFNSRTAQGWWTHKTIHQIRDDVVTMVDIVRAWDLLVG